MTTTNTVRMYPHHGSFEGEPLYILHLYEVTMHGFCDDTAGSVQEYGAWYGLIRTPINADTLSDELPELNDAELAELDGPAGWIVQEDAYGFFGAGSYATSEELDAAWGALVAELYDDEGEEQ